MLGNIWSAASASKSVRRMGYGAAAGGLYGGTFGRDPGQGRIGGAIEGALGYGFLAGAGSFAARTMGAGVRGMNNSLGFIAHQQTMGGKLGTAAGFAGLAMGQNLNRRVSTFGTSLVGNEAMNKFSAIKQAFKR
jgi:hypothetical protein